jgi:pyoverdine/dityrosine biosynthesis protein Dit1
LEEDEFIIIGNNNVSIYHLFEDCPHLEIDKDYLYFYSQKLKRLMLDAIIYQEEILLIFIEEFFLEKHFDIIEKLLEVGLSIQIITE